MDELLFGRQAPEEKSLNRLLIVTTLVAGACGLSAPAFAGFIQIATPGVNNYSTSTTLIAIPQPGCTATGTAGDPCPANTVLSSLSGGGLTLTFSSPDAGNLVIARQPVPQGWGSWNSPPAVESSTPVVVQDETDQNCTICTLNITFSSPIQTFGIEVEPDFASAASPTTITEAFLNGGTTVGTISNTFTNFISTAVLLAATTDQQFTGVSITINEADFAAAQFRYSPQQVTPEPGTILLAISGIGAALCLKRKARRQ